jgi:methyl-accepting chemotaxis protein
MTKEYKRRNIFIKRDFQGKLILGYFLFVVGGCLLFIFLFSLFSADTLTISYNNNDLQLGITPVMLYRKIIAAHWIFIVIGSAFLIFAAMLITHRIAGPLFRLEKALDHMLAQNLNDTIHLRQKDEGKELASKINQFNTELSDSIKKLHTCSDAIDELLSKSKEKLHNFQDEGKEDVRWLLWSMDEQNKRIKSICSSYKLKDEE